LRPNLLQKTPNESLEAYLANKVFSGQEGSTVAPDKRDVDGFMAFMELYQKGLVIERTAVEALR
jgi:hypothetical protein